MSARERWANWFDGGNGPFTDDAMFTGLTAIQTASFVGWLAAKADDAEICDQRVAWNMKTSFMLKPAHRANSIGAERGANECAEAIRATIDGGRS